MQYLYYYCARIERVYINIYIYIVGNVRNCVINLASAVRLAAAGDGSKKESTHLYILSIDNNNIQYVVFVYTFRYVVYICIHIYIVIGNKTNRYDIVMIYTRGLQTAARAPRRFQGPLSLSNRDN